MTGPDLRRLDGRLDISYRSDERPLVGAFYEPCMRESVLYRRAVGYFTSSGLALVARGLAHLVENGGRIELVCSPHLDEADIASIRDGYRKRTDVFAAAVAKTFGSVEDQLTRGRLEALAWLISEGRLDVKLAVRVDADGVPVGGIYHEKLGIFYDDDPAAQGHRVAFSGSANETRGGLVDNFESIDVFWSWDDPHGRVRRKEDQFARLWAGDTGGLDVVDFTEAANDVLRPYRVGATAPPDPVPPGAAPPELDKWRHQDDAVVAFMAAERGVLHMATGTGKTRTTIRICAELLDRGEVDTVIVSTYGNDLLDQWYGDLLSLVGERSPRPTLLRHYDRYKDRERFVLNPKNTVLLVSRSALAPALRRLRPGEAERTIVVHDEVHKLGSPSNRRELSGLSDAVRFRLGLSATPEREYDSDGTAFIEAHVGPVIFEFGLDDAIRRGILAPFDYHPLPYVPDASDGLRLQAVHKKKAAREAAGTPMAPEDVWTALAYVYKTSRAKIPVFADFVSENEGLLERCIVFVETRDYGEAVLRVLHRFRHDFHTYYGGQDSGVLDRFARGDLECLVTCHRLSEGIDVQSLRTVVLFASSRTKLETIQRIGRCIRTDPADPSKVAHVIDFVRPPESPPNADDERRRYLEALSLIRPDPC